MVIGSYPTSKVVCAFLSPYAQMTGRICVYARYPASEHIIQGFTVPIGGFVSNCSNSGMLSRRTTRFVPTRACRKTADSQWSVQSPLSSYFGQGLT